MGLLCSKGGDHADDTSRPGAPLPPRRVSELALDAGITTSMVYDGSTAEEVAPRCKSISRDGALFRSATRRRARLSRRKAGTVLSLGRDTATGAQVDLVVQSRPQTTLTDSVVEKMLQQCEAARSCSLVSDKSSETDTIDAAAGRTTTTSPPTSELLASHGSSDNNKGDDSCDTSLYSSNENDDTITLQPVRRKVQTLTDAQVQAMLAQAS